VVNSAFKHLREDLTRRSSTVKSDVSDAVSITRHVTVTSPASSVKPSKLPQSGATKLPPNKSHYVDSSVVKAHSGNICR